MAVLQPHRSFLQNQASSVRVAATALGRKRTNRYGLASRAAPVRVDETCGYAIGPGWNRGSVLPPPEPPRLGVVPRDPAGFQPFLEQLDEHGRCFRLSLRGNVLDDGL